MNKKNLFYFFVFSIIIFLAFLLWTYRDFPYSKAELLNMPEVAITQKLSEIKTDAEIEHIKILSQTGNNKERVIVFECKGKPKSAIAVSDIFGVRYNLLIADLTNSKDGNGAPTYNPSLPTYFRLDDYFYEREYTYFENQFTLSDSTYRMHDDIGLVIRNLMILAVLILADDHFKQYSKK